MHVCKSFAKVKPPKAGAAPSPSVARRDERRRKVPPAEKRLNDSAKTTAKQDPNRHRGAKPRTCTSDYCVGLASGAEMIWSEVVMAEAQSLASVIPERQEP
jgi:hypothetical protein